MKRFTLSIIVAAFTLVTACTDTEQVLPFEPTQEIEFTQANQSKDLDATFPKNIKPSDVQVGRSSIGSPELTAGNVYQGNPPTQGQDVIETYGELLPASFAGCGPFVRTSDGTLLNVLNLKVPKAYEELEMTVRIGYDSNPNINGITICDVGIPVNVTYIEFIESDVNDKAESTNNQSNTK